MDFIISLAILIYSAIIHEVSHGYVADKLGDPTARHAGRLTLNPKSHIDPFMSIFLPLILILSGSRIIFGAAKPVPIDPFNLKEGRKDVALVALAGPLSNIILAFVASFLLKILLFPQVAAFLPMFALSILDFLFRTIIQLNLLLAIFNLLPIPPLDGSKVFALVLPQKEANAYLALGSFGMIILVVLLFFPFAGFSLLDFVGTLLRFSQNLLLP